MNGPFAGRVRAELAEPVEDDGVHQSSTLQALLQSSLVFIELRRGSNKRQALL